MPRRKWDARTKALIVLQGLKGTPVSTLCTEHQISQVARGVLRIGEGEFNALRFVAVHGHRQLPGAKLSVPSCEGIRPRRQPMNGEGAVRAGDGKEGVC